MFECLCVPILLVDLCGSIFLIVISALCLHTIRQIVHREPDNFLYGYLYWLFLALFAFSLSRSLGHIVKHILFWFDQERYWEFLSPISGSINSALFILIASITVFFHKMKRVVERIEQDKEEIERISKELLRLNQETEELVSERTRAELALNIAHEIRNPIMVIGGIARRFLVKEYSPQEKKRFLRAILEQICKLDRIVREFELVKGHESLGVYEVDMNCVVNEAVNSVKEDAKRRGISLETLFEDSPLIVKLNADLINFAVSQVLRCMLDVAYSNSKIQIKTRRGKFGALVTISSIGIQEAKGGKSKEFYHSVLEERDKLGFSIVKQIVEEHGGSMQVKRENGVLEVELFLPFSIGTAKKWGCGGCDVQG